MAATNDFLAFGTGASPNVIDQPTYAALAARLTGFQSGVAQSAQLNKVWRQASIMAAVLAQFIVARTGQSATDDGTTATLLANLLASAAALNGDPTQQFAVAAATAGNQAVPLAQAQAMRGTYNGAIPIGASMTLTSAQVGASAYFFGSTAGQTITLPAAASLAPGEGYAFSNFASVPVTVARSGSDIILAGVGVSSIVLQPGDDLEIEPANNSQWIASGSSIRQFNPLAIAPATTGTQAATMAQASGVAGSARNLTMNVATASVSAAMTADEIVVETTLGGVRYCLANFSQSINLTTTGAGGMDTGSAPAPGYVALYAIYNPSTGARALLARNATSSIAPSIYGGSSMPSGYTASALVSVWLINSSGQFVAAVQRDRKISVGSFVVLNTTTQASSFTSFSVSAAIPANAVSASGQITVQASTTATCTAEIASDSNGSGGILWTNAATGPFVSGYFDVNISTPQTLYRIATVSTGSMSNLVFISSYTI